MLSVEATTLSHTGIWFLLNVVGTDLLSQDCSTLRKVSDASKRSDDAAEGPRTNQDQMREKQLE